MTDEILCSACGRTPPDGSPLLWDQQTYCVECLQTASPELSELAAAGGPLEETLEPEAIQTRHFVRSIRTPFLAVGLVFTVPFVPFMLIKGDIALAFFWTAGVALFVGMLFAVVTAGAGGSQKYNVPRTVSVEDGEFIVTTRGKRKSYSLRDCQWKAGSTQYDPLVYQYAGVQTGIAVRTPNGFVACGLTPERLALWTAFFRLTRLPEFTVPGCLPIVGASAFGLGIGGAIGLGIGSIAAFVTNVPSWKAVGGFLGAIDGACAGMMYRSCDASGLKEARDSFHPAVLAALYLLVGLKATRGMDVTTRIVCGIVSVLLGILVGWACQRKLDVVEEQRRKAASPGEPGDSTEPG